VHHLFFQLARGKNEVAACFKHCYEV
jgi:hypothetical protein